jgi:serine/threonine protein kinase
MAQAPFISSPQQIAGHPVLRELTPGTTYLADRTGRRVVLKRLQDDCLLEGELHPLIHDRLSRVRELAHVGVANLLAVEPDGNDAYLVWEYVEGTPLADFAPSLDPTGRNLIARDLVAAVETLHALGIVHGDIHGNNVIVTPAGRVTLTHVSPLLYNEERVDVEAVAKLLREMNCPVALSGSVPLRQLAIQLSTSDRRRSGSSDGEAKTDVVRHDRRGSLIAAILLSIAAVVIAVGVWSWTSRLSQSDELAPAAPRITAAAAGRQRGAD